MYDTCNVVAEMQKILNKTEFAEQMKRVPRARREKKTCQKKSSPLSSRNTTYIINPWMHSAAHRHDRQRQLYDKLVHVEDKYGAEIRSNNV